MDERTTSQTTVQPEPTDQNQKDANTETPTSKPHLPAPTSEEFYRQITARDDVREILKRLAR